MRSATIHCGWQRPESARLSRPGPCRRMTLRHTDGSPRGSALGHEEPLGVARGKAVASAGGRAEHRSFGADRIKGPNRFGRFNKVSLDEIKLLPVVERLRVCRQERGRSSRAARVGYRRGSGGRWGRGNSPILIAGRARRDRRSSSHGNALFPKSWANRLPLYPSASP